MTCEKCGRDFDKGLKELGLQMWGQKWCVEITCACGNKQEYIGEGLQVEAVVPNAAN